MVNIKVVLEEINVLKCMGLIARALKVIVNNGLFDVNNLFIHYDCGKHKHKENMKFI